MLLCQQPGLPPAHARMWLPADCVEGMHAVNDVRPPPPVVDPRPTLPPRAIAPQGGSDSLRAADTAPSWDPTPRRPPGLAQLRRIFIGTASVAGGGGGGGATLATQPVLRLQLPAAPWVPPDAVDAALDRHRQPQQAQAGVAAAASSSSGGSSLAAGCVSWVEFGVREPIPLPPDSLIVITLPLVLAVPAAWLGWRTTATSPGAAAAEAPPAGTAAAGRRRSSGSGSGGGSGLPGEDAAGPLVALVAQGEGFPFSGGLVPGTALFPAEG
jgi:hypothetical protein